MLTPLEGISKFFGSNVFRLKLSNEYSRKSSRNGVHISEKLYVSNILPQLRLFTFYYLIKPETHVMFIQAPTIYEATSVSSGKHVAGN